MDEVDEVIESFVGASKTRVGTGGMATKLHKHPPRFELAAAAALPLMAFTVVALWVQRRILGERRFTTVTGRAGVAKPVELGGWRRNNFV